MKIVKEMDSNARFPCWQPVLSFSLVALIHWFCFVHSPSKYTGSIFFARCASTLIRSVLLWSNNAITQCWDYSFYTSSGWPKFAYVTNPVPPETRCVTYKLHPPQGCSCSSFFILLALHMQDTFVLILNFL